MDPISMFQQAAKGILDVFSAKRQPVQAQRQEDPRLRQLRQNVIDQTAYTPQARRVMQTIPMYGYGQEKMSSVKNNNSGGVYDGRIGVNFKHNSNRLGGADVVRHELIHALDSNQDGTGMSDPQQFVNSFDFFKKAQQAQPMFGVRMNRLLKGSPLYQPDQRTFDKEGLAYYGMHPEKIQRPMQDTYSKIYRPMSVQPRYSPVYPTQQFLKANAQRLGIVDY